MDSNSSLRQRLSRERYALSKAIPKALRCTRLKFPLSAWERLLAEQRHKKSCVLPTSPKSGAIAKTELQ